MTMRTARTTAPMTSPHHTPRRPTCTRPAPGCGAAVNCGDDGVISVRLADGEVQRQPIEQPRARRIHLRRRQQDDLPLAVDECLCGNRKFFRVRRTQTEVDAYRPDRRL